MKEKFQLLILILDGLFKKKWANPLLEQINLAFV
jgi:hypothetical protein